MENQTIKELTSFIKNSPTAFHAVKSIRDILTKEGFQELKESEKWKIEKGGKYYVTRNHSSILAFKVGNQLDEYSFHVTASHSDSPTFKIKENAEIEVKKKYTVLNTEGYGGMICSTWFDRPLSVAGRVIVKTDSGMETRLVKVERDLLMIPSLAIHMDRAVNEGRAINKQVDMVSLQEKMQRISMFLPALTMKRLDQEPSREQHRHCCRMCFGGSTRHWERMRKISIVQLPEVLC